MNIRKQPINKNESKPRDYHAYAENLALKNFFLRNPEMFKILTDLIRDDLQDSYSYPADFFPRNQDSESSLQRKAREDMVMLWKDDFAVNEDLSYLNHIDSQAAPPFDTFQPPRCPDAGMRPRKRTRKKVSQESFLAAKEKMDEEFSVCDGHIGPVDAIGILKNALCNVRQHNSDRYAGTIGDIDEVVSNLKSCLRSEALSVLRQDRISREDLIGIGGDIHCHSPVVYFHMIWHAEMDQNDFYGYVGQAENSYDRIISQHKSATYRLTHPSLHYHVWDSRPDTQSAWILIATAKETTQTVRNLLELWACLIFQTLPISERRKYCSDQLGRNICRGLNLANPLWQGYAPPLELKMLTKKQRFSELIRNAKTLEDREYYKSLSREFTRLKESNDEKLRSFYLRTNLQSRISASDAKTRRTLGAFSEGCIKHAVRGSSGSVYVTVGAVHIRILKKYLNLEGGEQIYLQGFLSEIPTTTFFALEARSGDLAQRLSVRVTVKDEFNSCRTSFIRAGGKTAVMDFNTLVDQLDGRPDDEIAGLRRRRIPLRKEGGRLSSTKYSQWP
ncbi:hypothetical protein GQ53DRAFT_834234 [Thozetella sp. PMI_491]|nr:hypothetical protein GQ53DRAFT_834234 [Thozetella sp. PMI_491]